MGLKTKNERLSSARKNKLEEDSKKACVWQKKKTSTKQNNNKHTRKENREKNWEPKSSDIF